MAHPARHNGLDRRPRGTAMIKDQNLEGARERTFNPLGESLTEGFRYS
jgi:hypothetical protein